MLIIKWRIAIVNLKKRKAQRGSLISRLSTFFQRQMKLSRLHSRTSRACILTILFLQLPRKILLIIFRPSPTRALISYQRRSFHLLDLLFYNISRENGSFMTASIFTTHKGLLLWTFFLYNGLSRLAKMTSFLVSKNQPLLFHQNVTLSSIQDLNVEI